MENVITKWHRFETWIVKKGMCYYKVGQVWCMYYKGSQVLLQSETGLMHAF